MIANVEMAAAWDGDEGEEWARDWERYDRAVLDHHGALFDAATIGDDERVLDIGCGNGQSTRDAARAAGNGSAIGVDLSSRMVERARELAKLEGVTNVTFERVDAQVHPFDAAAYDVVISRFGAMFFADPASAFANIGAGLRPGGRLVMVRGAALTPTSGCSACSRHWRSGVTCLPHRPARQGRSGLLTRTRPEPC